MFGEFFVGDKHSNQIQPAFDVKSILKMDSNLSHQQTSSEDKVTSLIKALENDLDACDFKWTLFVAAANNYKYDSLLKPFPSAYVENKALNIGHLRETIASIPRFTILLQKLRNDSHKIENCISDNAIDLLYWCLISVKEPALKSVRRSNVSMALS